MRVSSCAANPRPGGADVLKVTAFTDDSSAESVAASPAAPLKIWGWANDHFGCGNYRMGLPLWYLNKMGHDATAFSVLDAELPADLDVLVGQLVATEDRTQVWRDFAALKGRNFAMVYEIDDDVWNLTQSNPSANHFDGPAGARVEENIRLADAVTVTTDTLAELVSRFNSNVHVLPNCFDATVLGHQRPRSEQLTIGWAGGSGHVLDFHYVEKDLRTFFRRNPQVDVHFMGVNHGTEVGRPSARHTGWINNLVTYIQTIDFDIGLAPLLYNAFNRSKSDLKFLEYASLGIPVVASDFGPYAESIVHGVTGLKVRYPHEWGKYLNELVKDPSLRGELGANAQAWSATRTIQANYWRWEDAYASALGRANSDERPARSAFGTALAQAV